MPIRVKCESCKKTLSVKDHLAGKKIKCPVCQHVVTVGGAGPAREEPPAKPAPPAPGIPVSKKPPAAPKPTPAPKPVAEKPPTNGTPPPEVAASNGAASKTPPPPEPAGPPPENVEEEALAALADEPAPVEEGPPQTIDFRCQWCDEELHLPIDLGGKQTQCPNEECRRIIKVPMPKVEKKKDWRKMDRKGPAAALINQPEELEDAWGTETTSRARQDSLEKAGAVEKPVTPVGAFGWFRRVFLVFLGLAVVSAAVYGVFRLQSSSQQHKALREIEALVKPDDPVIEDDLLRAEAHRALGILYLREPAGAVKSMRNFQGALGLVERKIAQNDAAGKGKEPAKRDPSVNEQLFLIDLALSQIEMGGTEDEAYDKKRQPWDRVRGDLANTLAKMPNLEAQTLALRLVGSRLIQRDQLNMAIQLAGNLSGPDPTTKKIPPAIRQQIALSFEKEPPKELDLAKGTLDGNQRIGRAEGHARKKEFDKAYALATHKGTANDRLEACLGAASIAHFDHAHQEEASRFLKEGTRILLAEKDANPSLWQQLHAIRLAARIEPELVEALTKKLDHPHFKLRGRLEVFLAKCDKTTATAEDLLDIEAADKEGITLALAWAALARTNGATREQNRKNLDARIGVTSLPENFPDLLRPLVDIGSYLGAKK